MYFQPIRFSLINPHFKTFDALTHPRFFKPKGQQEASFLNITHHQIDQFQTIHFVISYIRNENVHTRSKIYTRHPISIYYNDIHNRMSCGIT